MSQIEHNFRQLLSKKPELETCYQEGLINRRSLARYLVRHNIAKSNQLEAVIAMLRRFEFKEQKQTKDLFSKIKINIKDKIMILDFQKEKELIQKLHHLIENTNYDRGDTLKIVVGSCSVKVFLDEDNEKKVKNVVENFKLQNRLTNISEISVMFPEDAIKERGILSTITKELSVNEIVISELLTASPELLIYLQEEFVLKAYDILKRLQKT
jgi:mRNA-degrading endonuclease HigB of HigAB toxin-antitoxin module